MVDGRWHTTFKVNYFLYWNVIPIMIRFNNKTPSNTGLRQIANATGVGQLSLRTRSIAVAVSKKTTIENR